MGPCRCGKGRTWHLGLGGMGLCHGAVWDTTGGGYVPMPTPRDFVGRLEAAGVSADVLERLLPDWWDGECFADPALTPELEFDACRLFGIAMAEIRDPATDLAARRGSAFAPWTIEAIEATRVRE